MAAVAENGIATDHHHHRPSRSSSADSKSEFQRDVRELVDLLSKLNPSAKEFVPSSHSPDRQFLPSYFTSSPPPFFTLPSPQKESGNDGYFNNRKKKINFGQGRRRLNGRAFRAQREDSVRRTVYVSDIDQHVTEEHLAALFINCGQVVDCRVCGDPRSVLRFAFVEFADEQGARAALNLAGTMLGYFPVRVLPSKTAILPVNPTFLPRIYFREFIQVVCYFIIWLQSEDEREMCARTVYCTNIDKEVSQNDVKFFFESTCGEVSRLRLLGDHVHSTRIAFVEFAMAESAIAALSCSGMVLGTLPIRMSPSKTPVRSRVPRATLH